jgi:hypothetical protein
LKNLRRTKLPKLLKILECHSISLIRYIISLSLSKLKAEGKKKPHAKNHPKTQSLQKQKIKKIQTNTHTHTNTVSHTRKLHTLIHLRWCTKTSKFLEEQTDDQKLCTALHLTLRFHKTTKLNWNLRSFLSKIKGWSLMMEPVIYIEAATQ